MMNDGDPRVKKLQEDAWSLQNMSVKPGNVIPEDAKKSAYRLTSRVIALCTNAEYVEEEDFLERAAAFKKDIVAKRKELEQLEESIKQDKSGKCYRVKSDGGYEIGQRGTGSSFEEMSGGYFNTTDEVYGHAGQPQSALSAKEVMDRCAEDPECLWLGGAGIRDRDVEALLEGLRKSGSQLTSLDLSDNQMADKGIQKLVTGFAGGLCPKLQELWVTGNPFTQLGHQMLTSGLGNLRKDLNIQMSQPNVPNRGEGTSEVAEPKERQAPASSLPPASETPKKAEEPATTVAASPEGQASVGCSGLDFSVLDGSIQVKVHMPDSVTKADEFDLDLSEERVVVRGSDGSLIADGKTPVPVNPDTAQAKFSRRNHSLTVTDRKSVV